MQDQLKTLAELPLRRAFEIYIESTDGVPNSRDDRVAWDVLGDETADILHAAIDQIKSLKGDWNTSPDELVQRLKGRP